MQRGTLQNCVLFHLKAQPFSQPNSKLSLSIQCLKKKRKKNENKKHCKALLFPPTYSLLGGSVLSLHKYLDRLRQRITENAIPIQKWWGCTSGGAYQCISYLPAWQARVYRRWLSSLLLCLCGTLNIHRMWHAFVKISYLLNTLLECPITKSYFRKMDMT